MRSYLFLFAALWISGLQLSAQSNPPVPPNTYDAEMARKLGADEMGMRKYVIAFLKTGPVKLTDSLQRAELQKAHMQNITKLAESGKLIMAGPFMDNQALRGIYIFNVNSLEEAQQLTATDPAVKAGTLVMELHPWYGSAALMEIPGLHQKIQKKSFGD